MRKASAAFGFLLLIAMAVLQLLLLGCGAADEMKAETGHSRAVSDELERSLGVKCLVGFESINGSLDSVTVTFEHIPRELALDDIALKSRRAVISQFRQTPRHIIVGFAIDP